MTTNSYAVYREQLGRVEDCLDDIEIFTKGEAE